MTQTDCPSSFSAAEFLPRRRDLTSLARAARKCHGCPIYCNATQTVFGAGPPSARLMFIGEQPGDQEDRAGAPFVGPAGIVLDEALRESVTERDQVYVTNAVKHFKFEPRGKRRIHSRPNAREIAACRPWLEAEIAAIQPKMIVCLGATAAQSLLGSGFKITQHRGGVIHDKWADWMMATVHPSSLLRIPDREVRHRARAQFVNDLRKAAQALKKLNRESH